MLQNRYITQRLANKFVIEHHRHHGKVVGDIIRLGTFKSGELVGVAIIGRPSARKLNAAEICEVTRLATFGETNACSKLYSACARIARELGFLKIITYTGKDEDGTSLKASGWTLEDDDCGGTEWKRNDGERQRATQTLFGEIEKYPPTKRKRWAKILAK